MEVVHKPLSRCDKCVQTREKCKGCKFRCSCGWPKDKNDIPSKLSFRNHMKRYENEQPNSNARSQKLFSEEYVKKCVTESCCSYGCLRKWTFDDANSFLKQHANLSQKELDAKLVTHLHNLIDNEGKSVISGQHFTLKICGKTLCPKAFTILYGVSHSKLTAIIQNKLHTPEPENESEDETDAKYLIR